MSESPIFDPDASTGYVIFGDDADVLPHLSGAALQLVYIDVAHRGRSR